MQVQACPALLLLQKMEGVDDSKRVQHRLDAASLFKT
jgi:hypothetical protein